MVNILNGVNKKFFVTQFLFKQYFILNYDSLDVDSFAHFLACLFVCCFCTVPYGTMDVFTSCVIPLLVWQLLAPYFIFSLF